MMIEFSASITNKSGGEERLTDGIAPSGKTAALVVTLR